MLLSVIHRAAPPPLPCRGTALLPLVGDCGATGMPSPWKDRPCACSRANVDGPATATAGAGALSRCSSEILLGEVGTAASLAPLLSRGTRPPLDAVVGEPGGVAVCARADVHADPGVVRSGEHGDWESDTRKSSGPSGECARSASSGGDAPSSQLGLRPRGTVAGVPMPATLRHPSADIGPGEAVAVGCEGAVVGRPREGAADSPRVNPQRIHSESTVTPQ
jgi:hypothetical protein